MKRHILTEAQEKEIRSLTEFRHEPVGHTADLKLVLAELDAVRAELQFKDSLKSL